MNRLHEIISRLSRRFLLIPALFGVMSVLLAYYSDQIIIILVFALAAGAAVVVLRHERQERNTFMAAFVICLIVFVSIKATDGDLIPIYGDEYLLHARVISAERKLSGRGTVTLSTSEFGLLEYSVFEESDDLPVPGSVVTIRGILSAPERPRNPGEYDRESDLRRRGIRYSLKVLSSEEIVSASRFMKTVSAAEDKMFDLRCRITDLFGDDKATAAAIFLGDTSLIDKDTASVFRRMGCSHLLAVSGTHFSGFLAVPAMTGAYKKNGRRYKGVFVLFCILLGIFTGWSPSVTRAAIMSSCACCMKDQISGMSLASLMMLISDPRSVLSSGFLMSFCSCIGIIMLSGRIRDSLVKAGLNKIAASLLSAVLSAQAGMLPFNIMIDMRYGIIPVAIQTVASLIAQTACVFFLPSVILSLMFGEAFIFPAKIMMLILRAFLEVSSYVYAGAGISSVASVAVLSVILWIMIPKSGIKDIMRLAALVLVAVTMGTTISDLIIPIRAQIIFIDVGQGDSCLILSGGRSVIIDGGTYEAGRDHVVPVLDHYGVDVIDIALATHLDEDHLGGIRYLDECGRVSEILTPCPEEGMKAIASGDQIELSEYTVIRIIYPHENAFHDGENEDSLVCLIESSGTSVLMTGDIGIETEKILMTQGLIRDVDILKAAHHGSAYSTCGEFLDACTPEYAVISAGRHNVYGHPSPDTLQRLDERGIDILTTAASGAIMVSVRDIGYDFKVYA